MVLSPCCKLLRISPSRQRLGTVVSEGEGREGERNTPKVQDRVSVEV